MMNRARDRIDTDRLVSALGSAGYEAPTEARLELERRRLLATVAAQRADERRRSWSGMRPRRWTLGLGLCGAAAAVAVGLFALFSGHFSRPSPIVLSGSYVAVADDAVMSGAKVTVLSGHRGSLRLPDGSTIVALGPAELRVEGDEDLSVVLERGRILADIAAHAAPHRFRVVTGLGTIVVHGTVFSVDATDQRMTVRLYDGKIELEAKGQRLVLVPGRSAESGPEGLRGISPTSGLEQLTDAVAFGRRDLGASVVRRGEATSGSESEERSQRVEPQPQSQAYEEAKQAFERQDYAQAISLLAPQERSAPMAYLRGRAHQGLGQHRDAASAFLAMGELAPERASQANYLAAQALLAAGDFLAAADLAKRAVESQTTVAQGAAQVLFQALYQAEQWGQAQEACDLYLSRFPSGRFVPEALFTLGMAAGRAGDAPASRAALELYLRSFPEGEHAPQVRALLGN